MNRFEEILDHIDYKDWEFFVGWDGTRPYLQVHFFEVDVHDCVITMQTGRKWFLSEHMTRSEIVQTALKAVLTAEEHEARERFTYRGRRVFGPHLDVDALHEVAERVETRAPMDAV